MANDAARRPSGCTTRISARLILLLLGITLGLPALAAGAFTTQQAAGRAYKIYVPGGYLPGQRVPLVVMLHGCTQDPDKFARGTRMNDIAEQKHLHCRLSGAARVLSAGTAAIRLELVHARAPSSWQR